MNQSFALATSAVTMTSLEIAELVHSNHADVRRSMERLAERGAITLPPLAEVSNPGPGPRSIAVYRVCKRDSYVIVAQLSPAFTARLVDRWQELETGASVAVPQTIAQALRLAADQAERIEQQQLAIAAAKPAVEFVERYVQAEGLKGFRETCKLLRANEARFREFVISEKIMYRLGGTLTAHQNHIDAGRFEVRAGVADSNDHAFTTTKFTPKGIDWIAGEWAKYQLAQRGPAQ